MGLQKYDKKWFGKENWQIFHSRRPFFCNDGELEIVNKMLCDNCMSAKFRRPDIFSSPSSVIHTGASPQRPQKRLFIIKV